MDFLFFNAANKALFIRDDAESAQWTVDELSLVASFPYDPAKVLQRGQRIGFTDDSGVFQPFEIRKCESMEPDHYQRITAEHIVISELSDEHCPGAAYTDITAQEALSAQLVGTLWSIGNVTASGTSSADISMGSKWQAVRTIEKNWNVYITPRVTFSAMGITGRYLDIAPAQHTWRGVRLSIDKNADELGVTYDDTDVLTAMYGYGRSTTVTMQTVYPLQLAEYDVGYKLVDDGLGGLARVSDGGWTIYRLALPQRMAIKLDEITANSQVSGVATAAYENNSVYYPASPGARVTADALLVNCDVVNYLFSALSLTYTPEADSAALNFGGVVWTTSGGDPADKPSGQTYVEDVAATAAYGRNGRPRFGYYQNGGVDDPARLLDLTWEALQRTNAPKVSIDMMVRDLYRLGYADQPIRLHDLAMVEIEPIGVTLRLEIIRLAVDLLDPTATRPTIGEYIPDIVYINRETMKRAGGSGGGGGRGQTNREKELSEFETEIAANNYQISLRAYQRDMNNVENILRQAGISIDAHGVIVYAADMPNMLQSKINVQADRIGLVVEGTGENAHIKAAQIMLAINGDTSAAYISADKIYLNGQTSISSLFTVSGSAVKMDLTQLYVDQMSINARGDFQCLGYQANWGSQSVVTNATLTYHQETFLDANGVPQTIDIADGINKTTTTLYCLMRGQPVS